MVKKESLLSYDKQLVTLLIISFFLMATGTALSQTLPVIPKKKKVETIKTNSSPAIQTIKDSDNDGIIDSKDGCPYEYGPVTNNGCPEKKAATNYRNPTAFDYGYGPNDAPTVTIGSQVWLGKNLNVDHFANGDPIPEAKTADEWKSAGENKQPAWCYYNNDPANGRTYGKLYNWYAVNDPRGLAPRGWHIPSDEEWTATTTYLGGEATAGLSMKSTSGWNENGNGNNNSGIAGLPGGYRGPNGAFNDLGEDGSWWSSSEYNTGNAWSRLLYYSDGNAYRPNNFKSCGFSVRCLRD